MRSIPSDRLVSMSVRARPPNRFQDGPKGRQPVLMESDLARTLTHTLTGSRSGVVDRQRVTSTLAAGSVQQYDEVRRARIGR